MERGQRSNMLRKRVSKKTEEDAGKAEDAWDLPDKHEKVRVEMLPASDALAVGPLPRRAVLQDEENLNDPYDSGCSERVAKRERARSKSATGSRER